VLAIIREFVYEGVGDCAALALALDIGGDLGYVAANGGPVNEARHLTGERLVQTVKVLARVAADVLGSEAAAFSFRCGKLGAKLNELRLIDGVANSILGRGEAAGCKLGLHPLGSIRCEFDFQDARPLWKR
jgi:hypothetical protein